MRAAALLLALLALAIPAAAQPASTPLLTADLSTDRVEISTGFTGASVIVFGATERLIGAESGEDVVVLATGPAQPTVVRRKVNVLGFWVNGPAATFPEVPGFYAIAATRPVWQALPEQVRRSARLGLDALPLRAEGSQAPAFRAALLDLKQQDGRWQEYAAPVSVAGGRLFSARISFPDTVQTGDYRIEVLLVRERRIVARQELFLRVDRVGTAASIAHVARAMPAVYGIGCIILAALAGWLGSVIFRRG
ncbi:TIGR02186 family protein [Roseomonas sp. HF4]|uniref:TIGR02186 family protein n=1 Tax=Roseomonas sp. HF4 TaxID=2562313 RepID=UPI0010C0486B|nr:TIGR02186 family protein [Roseomonas sp. HF4]